MPTTDDKSTAASTADTGAPADAAAGLAPAPAAGAEVTQATTTGIDPTNPNAIDASVAAGQTSNPSSVILPASEVATAPPVIANKNAVVIVGNHRLPKDGSMVIVVQQQDYTYETDEDAPNFGEVISATPKKDGYPGGADLYFRMDYSVAFPQGEITKVKTLGDNILQGYFWGFTPNPQFVHTGPSHPAMAGANLAWQRGAKNITIVGLNDKEKALIQPYIDALPTDVLAPVTDVTITFAD